MINNRGETTAALGERVFRAVYELALKGLPEEVSCVTRLGEYLFSRGSCVGTYTSFVCSYRECLIKVCPHIVRPHYLVQEPLQAGSVKLIIESPNSTSLVDALADVYKLLRECGLTLRLLPE